MNAFDQQLIQHCQPWILEAVHTSATDELTFICSPDQLLPLAQALKETPEWAFKTLVDLCAVDYLDYPSQTEKNPNGPKARFAVVYHLLSVQHCQRLRLKVLLDERDLVLDSVLPIWPSANWYEREAFDLFGIAFKGHPDLRRLLTDYGFVGHPFRKDFPLSGYVEMRYDAAAGSVVYEPVSIQPRTLVPKVYRADHRYLNHGDQHA